MNSQAYLVSNEEFVMMAATAGIHEIYGFDMHLDEMEKTGAVHVLQELSKKGFVVSDGEKFRLTGVMEDIFHQIRDADTMMEVHKKSGRKCILYLGEQAVKVQKSMRRKELFELYQISLDEVWHDLQDEGWIPQKI